MATFQDFRFENIKHTGQAFGLQSMTPGNHVWRPCCRPMCPCRFDTASLKPTYRLMWGAAGASNALSIARTLGGCAAGHSTLGLIVGTGFIGNALSMARAISGCATDFYALVTTMVGFIGSDLIAG